jgi:hypothetical protein
MQMNDYEKLAWSIATALLSEMTWDGVGAPTATEPASARHTPVPRVPAVDNPSMHDVSALAANVQRVEQAVQLPLPQRVTGAPPEAQSRSVAGTVGSTLLKATGAGPLVRGLIGLFSSDSNDESAATIFPTYSAPPSVAVEAGLDGSRQFTGISYSGSGLPRAAAPVVQVNVQAMDSRSFLDHSNEIARAVKEAMLNSHGLNDVVMEL